jgi:hypothetical protein
LECPAHPLTAEPTNRIASDMKIPFNIVRRLRWGKTRIPRTATNDTAADPDLRSRRKGRPARACSELVEMVRVELAGFAPGVRVAGLKADVADAGKPLTLRLMGLLKDPPIGVTTIVYDAEPPGKTYCVVGFNATEKVGGLTAVPLKATDCGELGALSARVNAAVKDPAAVGENVTEKVQLALIASDAPQVVVCANTLEFAPLRAKLVKLSAAFPVFVRVTVCATLVPATKELKVSAEGERSTAGAGGAVAVPLSMTLCGVPEALSARYSDAVELAAIDEIKVTEILQLAPAANEVPQVLVSAKLLAPLPLMVMVLIERAALPVLVSVTA